MSYQPTEWSGKTPITTGNLNNIERGITEAHESIAETEGKVNQIANNQIPEEYLQESVNQFIEENEAGLATKTELSALNSQLSSEIGDIVGDAKSPNMFNKNDELIMGKIIAQSGDLSDNSNYGVSQYIEVEPNKGYVCYYGEDCLISKSTVKAFYDENKVLLSTSLNVTENIAPENAKYIRLTVKLEFIDTFMLVESTVNISGYIPYSPMECLAKKDVELLNAIEEMKPYFRTANLFDKTNVENVKGEYFTQDGEWSTNSNYGESHFIEIEPNKGYICYYGEECLISKSTPKAWFDENKNFISASLHNEVNVAPSNAKYMRHAINLTYWDTTMVVEAGVNVTEYMPYYSFEKAEEMHWWNGKKWYAYGTSLTSVSQGKYVPYVVMHSGLEVVNKGIGGGGIVSNTEVKNAVMNTTDGKLEADLITLEIGANDMGSPIGDIYDTSDNTFCGALNQCIRYLQENTNAQIVVISSTCGKATIPNNVYGDDNHTRFDQWEAMRKVCAINSCHYIPMGESGGMGYARITNSNLYNVDNIHHTELGGYNLAQVVWSYLKNIPLWYSELPQ